MKTFFLFVSLLVPTWGYAHLNPPQVISLIPPDNNLENENQIEVLCPKTSMNFELCRKEKLSPLTWNLNVYEKPDFNIKPIGKIQIIGTPGKGLLARYIAKGKAPIDFPSDSKGTDWGYSCYFEFTVGDVKGDWIQLPKRPFTNSVWINIKKDWPNKGDLGMRPKPRSLDNESVYAAGTLGNIVITKFSGNEFNFRKENPNDMSCGDEPKKISPVDMKESTKPISILFDREGHLIAWPAYCRGC